VTVFFDTNILVYAQEVGPKGERARALLAQGGVISVQVLNELANVLRKKHRRSWEQIEQVLGDVDDALDEPLPVTFEIHAAAVLLARDHGLSIFDALIVAAALEAGCDTLFSEDLQHQRSFGPLRIVNPFVESPS
jgi:predicted nucleic acid-binding protein